MHLEPTVTKNVLVRNSLCWQNILFQKVAFECRSDPTHHASSTNKQHECQVCTTPANLPSASHQRATYSTWLQNVACSRPLSCTLSAASRRPLSFRKLKLTADCARDVECANVALIPSLWATAMRSQPRTSRPLKTLFSISTVAS